MAKDSTIETNHMFDKIVHSFSGDPFEVRKEIDIPNIKKGAIGRSVITIGSKRDSAICAATLLRSELEGPEIQTTDDLIKVAKLVNYGGWAVIGVYRESVESLPQFILGR